MEDSLENLSIINKEIIQFNKALKLIFSLKNKIKVRTEEVNLKNILNRVLVNNLTALCDNPPTDVSSMDGYALNEKDYKKGKKLQVIGESSAGHSSKKHIRPGCAIRIFTGAEIPKGANKVILQENVKILKNNKIKVNIDIDPNSQNIRIKGSDFLKGKKFKFEKFISPREILLLASMGHNKCEVFKKIKISIISIGNELINPGEKNNSNKIFASNAYGIAGLLKNFSCDCNILPIVGDQISLLNKSLKEALKKSDLILTVGGASVGKYDLTKSTLKKAGINFIFHKVNIRPGKPTFAGILGETPIIGLPGNPVSSYVCSQLFVIPLIQEVFKLKQNVLKQHKVILNKNIIKNSSRYHFMRGNLFTKNKLTYVNPNKKQDSSMVKTLQESDCLILRPPYEGSKKKGDRIDIIKLI